MDVVDNVASFSCVSTGRFEFWRVCGKGRYFCEWIAIDVARDSILVGEIGEDCTDFLGDRLILPACKGRCLCFGLIISIV